MKGADALVICTEWKEFRIADFGLLKAELSRPVIFDGRNLYDPPRSATMACSTTGLAGAICTRSMRMPGITVCRMSADGTCPSADIYFLSDASAEAPRLREPARRPARP